VDTSVLVVLKGRESLHVVLAVHCRELLEKIAHFERRELNTMTGPSLHKLKKLDPLNTAGGDKLLQMVRRAGG